MVETRVLETDGDGLRLAGWLDSESGTYFARRSLRQQYRSHTYHHISNPKEGRVRALNPACRWCNGELPPIPLDQLGLSKKTIDAGKPPASQRRSGSPREGQEIPDIDRERETRRKTSKEKKKRPPHRRNPVTQHRGVPAPTVRRFWDESDPLQAPFD
jgi:hypothetical protein